MLPLKTIISGWAKEKSSFPTQFYSGDHLIYSRI